MEIGIIADDLTGAADAVAGFARRGFAACVGFKSGPFGEWFSLAEGEVLAYDTATRDIARNQEQAIDMAVRQAARKLAGLEPLIVFKKIDSTLRGHLRLELEAMRQEFPNRLAIVCPAFPAQGRTVKSGVLHIHDTPWTETDFAPSGQFGNGTVRSAFGMETEPGAREITLSEIRMGVDVLKARLQTWKEQGAHTVFCDAATESDLDLLAQTILRQPHCNLPVGSAGLARAIAALLPVGKHTPPTVETLMEPFHKGRVLVVVGSLHAVSREQSRLLAERLQATPVVLQQAGVVEHRLERAWKSVCRRYRNGARVVALTTPDVPDGNLAAQEYASLPGCAAYGVCMRQWQSAQEVDAVVICGGNTALELCRKFEGTGLRIVGEWEPGIAVCQLIVAPNSRHKLVFDGLPIVTKAGGFGDEATLARCVGVI